MLKKAARFEIAGKTDGFERVSWGDYNDPG